MSRNLTVLLFVVMFSTGLLPAHAGSAEDQLAVDATTILEEIAQIPEQSIPPELFDEAYAIAVLPSVIKAGLFIGGSHGQGLLTVRTPEREWSNPSFINLYGGSFGFQFGIQSSDIILVFKHQRSVDNILNGKIKLGVDASVAAGPVGRRAEASTDEQLKAEVYSYSRARGFFAGISLDGSVLDIDDISNARFYQQPGISSARILTDVNLPRPEPARRFIQTLNKYTPKPSS